MDKPAIQLIVEEAVNSGIEEILIITSERSNAIEKITDRAGVGIAFIGKG